MAQKGKDDIDKALSMLKLLHPDSYEDLMGVIGTIVMDMQALEEKILNQDAQIDVLNSEVKVLKQNQDATWSHAMSKPKPM